MVLFKRKAIEFFPPPETPVDLDTEVWFLPETGEWFTEYDDYLKRLDYYNTRKFVCESTGITGYTFWEALEIETQEIKKVKKLFPEAVKEPILRYVQFSLIQRIDLLIDDIYYKFKNDFFPGDQVNVKIPGTPLKEKGVVKEKLRFNAITLPNGEERKAYCQYRVLLTSNDREVTCDENDLSRDRLVFTKLFIRGFIKLALIKSPRVGSPWVVKDSYAKKYRISADYPANLLIFKEDLEGLPINKRRHDDLQVNLQPLYPLPQTKKRKVETENELSFKKYPFAFVQESLPSNSLNFETWRRNWLEVFANLIVFVDESQLKPADFEIRDKVIDLFKSVNATIISNFDPISTNFIITKRSFSPNFNYHPNDFFHEINEISRKVWSFDRTLRFFNTLGYSFNDTQVVVPDIPYAPATALKPLEAFMKIPTQSALKQQTINNHLLPLYPKGATPEQILKINQIQLSRGVSPLLSSQQSKKPPLLEDLSLPFQINDKLQKPTWKKIENEEITRVSELLESWCFLNIYRKALLLDNFTLDDYITAITWSRDDLRCQLLEEIFCSTMKCVLNDEVKVGGNNTHGISRDENAVGDGEQYLILIPRKGGYITKKTFEDPDEVKTENGMETKVESEEIDGVAGSSEDGAPVKEDEVKEELNSVEEESVNVKEEDSIKKEEEDQEQEKKKEEEEEEEDEEEEESTNNIHKFLFYKKKTWQERLRKRQFKDGQWLMILVGILSLVEHVPRYSNAIKDIFDTLAPVDVTATQANLLDQFYNRLPFDLRISAITILCELLTSGVVIRNFIDKSLEDATQLRKERIEIVREYKSYMEQASNINKECRESVIKNKKLIKVEKKPVDTKVIKKQRGGRPPVLKDAPSDEEIALLEVDKDFAKILNERVNYLNLLNEAKSKKKDVEFKLNELDMQRVNYIGRDRLYNRYWWFESNGLPTFRSSKKVSDEDDDDAVDDSFEDDEEDEDGMKDETYLVGRLFVQGPSDDDRLTFLNITDEILDEWEAPIPTENDAEPVEDINKIFELKCHKIFGLKFQENSIKSSDDKVLVDEYGATSIDLISKAERKFIEEKPDPLIHREEWRYIDTPLDLEKLLAYLNKLGERESLLLKELELSKDSIKLSMDSRIKLLGLEKKSNDELKLEEKIDAIEISDLDEGMTGEDDDEEDDFEDDNDSSLQIVTPRDSESDDSDEIIQTRRTRTRGSLRSNTEPIHKPELKTRSQRNGLRSHDPPLDPPVKQTKNSSLKKSRRQRLKTHDQKVKQKERLVNALEHLRNNRNEVRCLEWVNSSCINETGSTHYEGVKESRPKGRSKR